MTQYLFARRMASARRLLMLAAAMLGASPAIGRAQSAPPAHAARIEQARVLARAFVASDTLPGLSIAVGLNGEIVWAEGFGWADVEQRRPVTTATQFRVGSTAKAFTSAAVGLLHQRGRLDLDAPVRDAVPEFAEKAWPVTLRQLMGHTAGIRHYRTVDEMMSREHCTDVRGGIGVFNADSLLFRPGTRYSYSSYGFALASAVVQARAGEPFGAFMQREVFARLGMRGTVPDLPGRAPDEARGYTLFGELRPAPEADVTCVLAAGGYLSTPSDLVRFGQGMLANALLSPPTVQLLWTAQRLESGEATGYGMGWYVRRARLAEGGPAVPMMGHGGSSIGGQTSFMIFPGQRMVIAVSTNVSDADGTTAFAGRLAQLFASPAP